MAQDYDLWLRIVETAEVANIAEPLCKYRVRADSMTYAKEERQMNDAAWAYRLAVQRQIFGRDELGYAPAAEPFDGLRRALRGGFVARRVALSNRYLLAGREFPFRQGRLSRALMARYVFQSLLNNPLNTDTWRYIFHKSSGKARRGFGCNGNSKSAAAKAVTKDDRRGA